MRRLTLGILVVLALLGAPAPAHAAGDELAPSEDNAGEGRSTFNNGEHLPPAQACRGQRSAAGSTVVRVLPAGPRQANGALAFTSGACVYLPPDYATSTRRYPTLYLLHGGGGDQGDWITYGHAQQIADDFYARDRRNALIIITPDGTSGAWFDDVDGTLRNEEYVLRWLIPYIDRHYRTIADRSARAIDGLSNGGYGAMHLAAKAPDLFSVAGAMSGNLDGYAFVGRGDQTDRPAYSHGQTPTDLAGNLDGIDLTIDWGAACSGDLTVDLCATWAFEQSFRYANQRFRDELSAVGHRGAVEYRETEGSHAWRWWTAWLRDRHLPFILDRIARGTPMTPGQPATFRYRSIAPAFSVYGYDVRVTRAASEFLDLSDVTATGMTLKGSGRATIRTAARYVAGATYDVDRRPVVADGDGRLTFDVDLGPSHTAEQYSADAQVAEAAGDYWTTRTVRITSVAPGTPLDAPILPATGGTTPAGLAAVLLLVVGVTRRRVVGR